MSHSPQKTNDNMLFRHLLTRVFSRISNDIDAGRRRLNSQLQLIVLAHPTTLSSASSTMASPQSPRCSTPLFAKQRRTRPFIACELCRQRAFQPAPSEQPPTNDNPPKIRSNKTPIHHHHHHHHSATLQLCQYKGNSSSLRRRRQRSSIDQLLVWIV